MSFSIDIVFGWMAEPILKQIESLGPHGLVIDDELRTACVTWQAFADSILNLRVNGFMTVHAAQKARTKLAERITNFLIRNKYVDKVS